MMSHRATLNLVLLGFIAILSGLVIYTQYREKPLPSTSLTALKAENIQQIKIERPQDTLVFNKDAQGDWSLTAPVTIAARTFRIESLLKLLSTTQYQVIESQSLQLADVKLDPPLVRVMFDQFPVAFGDSSPLNDGQRYVQVQQKVYLLLDTFYSALIDDLTTFMSLSPLGNSPKMVELKLPDYHLRLQEGLWQMISAPPEYVDSGADAISVLIENWQQSQAFTIKPYDGQASIGAIEVTLQGQTQPLHFALIATEPELILALPEKEIQYHFSIHQVEKLLHLPKKAVKDEVGNVTTTHQ